MQRFAHLARRSHWAPLPATRSVRIEAWNFPCRERISVILPVLDEATRIAYCLDSLIAQTEEAAEILIIDGGSTDGTQSIVDQYHCRDARVRLIDASPVDKQWTGKAWGLYVGLANSSPASEFILCVDADVRCSPLLVRSLLGHVQRTGVAIFSVATIQNVSGPAQSLIHPALLTTLVYRFGRPGKATTNLHKVAANGQCFLCRRAILLRTGALQAAQKSLCEDITIARRLAECGETVGFYESDSLVEVRMYESWQDAWRNWPRSLAMRDQYFGWREILGLARVLLLQGLSLPILIVYAINAAPTGVVAVFAALFLMRLGILAGMAHAYRPRRWSYWLSPLLDLPVSLRLIFSALARRHVWRGQLYVRRAGGIFEAADR
jgi:dolichol-phosphate mannosyltransferase